MKTFYITITTLILSFSNTNGQSSKKEAIAYNKQILQIEVSDVRNGKHLDLAQEMPVDKFVQYYLGHGKKSGSKKYGDLSIEELYGDSSFTYFGSIYSYGFIKFIKVKRDQLSVDFIKLDGRELRERFIKEIIPVADKKRVERKQKDCSSSFYTRDFRYTYFKDSDEVEIKCHWKISCGFGIKIINKEYVARFNIVSRQFSK